MTRDDFLGLLSHDNLQAFLRLIREGESSQSEDAYRTLFGGKLFDSFEDHPRVRTYEKDDEFIRNGKKDFTTAAGAYQIVASTWDPLAKRYGLNDFGSTNQDIAAVALIHERGALDFVLEGRVHEAIDRLKNTWASLPGSTYGQPTQKLEKALAVYRAHGGRIAGETGRTISAVVDPPRTTTPPKEVKPMPAPLAVAAFSAFLPEIIKLIPKLGAMFGSGSEVQQRNVAAASMVGEAIVAATNTPNLQAAIETMQADPAALRAASSAIDDLWPSIGEAGGGGIKGARDAALAPDGDWRKLIFTFPFAVFAAIMPLIWAVVLASLLKFEWLSAFTDDQRIMVLAAVINLGLGSLIGFAFGTSIGSQKKDAMLGRSP